MTDIKDNETLQIILIVGLILGAMNGLITLIKFLEEREIARKTATK